jgi:hypothetical protein
MKPYAQYTLIHNDALTLASKSQESEKVVQSTLCLGEIIVLDLA